MKYTAFILPAIHAHAGIGDMTQNTSYIATIPMKQNKAYEETPHMYEEVKNVPYYNPAEA